MKSIIQQYQEAEAAYREALSRHPRSARTTVCWARYRDLKAKVLVHISESPASAPRSQSSAEQVSA